ncbi:hypothetical protein [Stigmatella erecta]|uniref:Uncharacterized protein n=1 Tax=Stigmatella erecta TaxID=83460 RepID=A0A1I0GUA6_9BACT|nr:hypothetical protein [Stigmatella erecta]SET74753.1 hypothetical protein SAMN05443639_104171 [Stigmatella erecta]
MQIDARTVVDAQTAYRAMEIFLEAFWNRGGQPEALTDLISWLPLAGEGQSADPAQWFDWLDALEKAIRERALRP